MIYEKRLDHPVLLDEVVLIGNDNEKRIDCTNGRIVEHIPGADKKVRLVKATTSKGQLLTRPIQRIYPSEVVKKTNLLKVDVD